jgi:hypothetical protein
LEKTKKKAYPLLKVLKSPLARGGEALQRVLQLDLRDVALGGGGKREKKKKKKKAVRRCSASCSSTSAGEEKKEK